jgi:hypothetical protein
MDSMDLMEQRVHELDARLRQMKEERDNVITENEELQDQLDMTNTSASAGMQKINELKNEVQKLAEEVSRIDYGCTSQEHELKTLSDHMCDLNSLKEAVKEHSEELQTIKEDYSRMKTHLNVSAKLELQTQERMYESRLHHLENVLEEMRQREGHFLHLAEETAALKDQVDALRELSVMVLKDDALQRSTLPPSAIILESPVRSQSNFSFKSDDNTLEKEMLANAAMTMQQDFFEDNDENHNNNENNQDNQDNQDDTKEESEEEKTQDNVSRGSSKNEMSHLMTLSKVDSPRSGIKVSGTLKLMKPFEVQNYSSSQKKLLGNDENAEYGCFPRWLATIWSTIFD